MRNFIRAISGHKALCICIVLTIAATILELVTSIRLENYTFDYRSLGIVWTSVAAWAMCTEEKEKKSKNIAFLRLL